MCGRGVAIGGFLFARRAELEAVRALGRGAPDPLS
jgi:hypothetical protein